MWSLQEGCEQHSLSEQSVIPSVERAQTQLMLTADRKYHDKIQQKLK
jgi:hypothetical protein